MAAEALLLDAGYSGNLTIDINHPSVSDGTLLLLMADYFDAIGVTSNIIEIDQISFADKISSMEAYGLTWYYYSRFTLSPDGWVSAWHYNGGGAGWMHDQPISTYDNMVEAMIAASTPEQQRDLVQQCDQYALEKHFAIPTPLRGSFVFWQPWFFGFDAEGWAVIGGAGAQVWIDKG